MTGSLGERARHYVWASAGDTSPLARPVETLTSGIDFVQLHLLRSPPHSVDGFF
jgi:hypothetical protein